jgi:hypothetical protein
MCFQHEPDKSSSNKPQLNGGQRPPMGIGPLDGAPEQLEQGDLVKYLDAQPALQNGKLVAFRANGLYEFVLRRVQQELAKVSPEARISLCIAPRRSTLAEIRQLLQGSLQSTSSVLMLSDRTTERAIAKVVTQYSQRRSLDDVFGSAAGAVLLERFGATFFNSPNDCVGDTAEQRDQNFLRELKIVLPRILKLGFETLVKVTDQQVVVFTEELSSHAPFYYVERLGIAPGELLRESLVQIGIPPERITVVTNPQQLLRCDYLADDPFLNISQASSVVFLGDRHRVSSAWIRDGIIRGLNLSLSEELAVAQKLFGVRRRGEPVSPGDKGQPAVDPYIVDAVVELVRRIGLGSDGGEGPSRAIYLRMPLENFLMDVSRQELLNPASAVDPETLVPFVTRDLLGMLKPARSVSN